jgi:hypothetical protein
MILIFKIKISQIHNQLKILNKKFRLKRLMKKFIKILLLIVKRAILSLGKVVLIKKILSIKLTKKVYKN